MQGSGDPSAHLQSPLQHSALCVIAALDSLTSVLYLSSSVRWLGSFWIPPSVLWLGNCPQAVSWDSLGIHLVICLRDQNPMCSIMQCLKTMVSSLRQDAVSGSCDSNILRSRKFSFLFFFFSFPYFCFCFLFLRRISCVILTRKLPLTPFFNLNQVPTECISIHSDSINYDTDFTLHTEYWLPFLLHKMVTFEYRDCISFISVSSVQVLHLYWIKSKFTTP